MSDIVVVAAQRRTITAANEDDDDSGNNISETSAQRPRAAQVMTIWINRKKQEHF